MYIARFPYAVLPVNRQRAIDFIRREVEAAQRNQLNARLHVPLTRGHGGAALQFEVELTDLEAELPSDAGCAVAGAAVQGHSRSLRALRSLRRLVLEPGNHPVPDIA